MWLSLLNMNKIEQLYQKYANEVPQNVEQLPISGSNRRYYRIFGSNSTCIAVKGTSIEENKTFITLADHFYKQGLPVPQVYSYSDDYSCYLQEDLGDDSLFNLIATQPVSNEVRSLLHETMRLLPDVQYRGAEGLDFSMCYPQPEFDRRTVMFDLNYFKYCFLKSTGLEFDEMRLEDDFETMADVLLRHMSDTFLYRDFQARNVMVKDGKPYLIDFQGGRKGPIYYDVASFLWQARANYSSVLRQELLDSYLEALQRYQTISKETFFDNLRHFVLFRTLQVLGAYGFRGYFEKKQHFLQSVPFAVANLRELLEESFPEYSYLTEVLLELTKLSKFEPADPQDPQRLLVRIFSFSYKKGIPEDVSGNGGGYVFDCRSMHNPGRYEPYKKLTGVDEPVIQFLEKDGEIVLFLKSVYALADVHVARYMERGFTNLMFSFGCTGGQHRSVYAAEHLATHLAEKFDVDIVLEHREQGIRREFLKK